jgi:hypothetical protein
MPTVAPSVFYPINYWPVDYWPETADPDASLTAIVAMPRARSPVSARVTYAAWLCNPLGYRVCQLAVRSQHQGWVQL